MRKSTAILTLALGLATLNLSASNDLLTSNTEVATKTVEVNALCKAVATGDMESVNNLISNGADVNTKSNGMAPIHYAAKYNRVDMIKVLYKAGADMHLLCDLGYTPLRHAEKTNAKEAVQILKRFKK